MIIESMILLGGLLTVMELNLRVKYCSAKARWYLIHSITNMAVVVSTLPSLYTVLTVGNLTERLGDASIVPSLVVMALHLFHACFYKMTVDDMIHHSVMLTVLLVPILNPNTIYLTISNYSLFFLCGLPGGIDYYMMFLVENGLMEKVVEKRYNVLLNTWIRAPGILFGAARCYILFLEAEIPSYVCLPVITVLLWNAQYYSSQVSQSYGRWLKDSADLI